MVMKLIKGNTLVLNLSTFEAMINIYLSRSLVTLWIIPSCCAIYAWILILLWLYSILLHYLETDVPLYKQITSHFTNIIVWTRVPGVGLNLKKTHNKSSLRTIRLLRLKKLIATISFFPNKCLFFQSIL